MFFFYFSDEIPDEQCKQSNECDATNSILHERYSLEAAADDVVVVPPDSSCECSVESVAAPPHPQPFECVPVAITNATAPDTANGIDERQACERDECDEQCEHSLNESICSVEGGSICTVNDRIKRGFTATQRSYSVADTHTDERLNENTRTTATPIQSMASMSTHTQVEIVRSGNERRIDDRTVVNESSNGTDEIPTRQTPEFLSLVMITEPLASTVQSNEHLLPSNTSRSASESFDRKKCDGQQSNRNDDYAHSLSDYYTRSLEEDSLDTSIPLPASSTTISLAAMSQRRPVVTNHHYYDAFERNSRSGPSSEMASFEMQSDDDDDSNMMVKQCYPVELTEDGLADDDSWIDSADESEIELAEVVPMCTAIEVDRISIDFTLHTIVEESSDESEVETNDNDRRKRHRASASDLERYFFFGLGASATGGGNGDDSISDTSSLQSETMDSTNAMNGGENDSAGTAENDDILSSQLEKYFMSTFMMPQNKVNIEIVC